jgi:hypothetical protein
VVFLLLGMRGPVSDIPGAARSGNRNGSMSSPPHEMFDDLAIERPRVEQCLQAADMLRHGFLARK